MFFLCQFSGKDVVLITQTEVNAVFDEQVRLCADTLQKKSKVFIGQLNFTSKRNRIPYILGIF